MRESRQEIPLATSHAGAVEVPIRRFLLDSTLLPGQSVGSTPARWNSKDNKIEASVGTATLHDTHILAGDDVTRFGHNFGLEGEQFTARKDVETGRWTPIAEQGLRRWGLAPYSISPGAEGLVQFYHDPNQPSCQGEDSGFSTLACLPLGFPPVDAGDWVYAHYHFELKKWKIINSKSVVVGAAGLILVQLYSPCMHPTETGKEFQEWTWNAGLGQYEPSGVIESNLDDPAGRNFLWQGEFVWAQRGHGRTEIVGENGLTRRGKIREWKACGQEVAFDLYATDGTACPVDPDDLNDDINCAIAACPPIPSGGTVGVQLTGNSCAPPTNTILQDAFLEYIPQTKRWHVIEWIKPPDLWATVPEGESMHCISPCVAVEVERFMDGCELPANILEEYQQKVKAADNPKHFTATEETRLHLKYDYSTFRYFVDDVVRICGTRWDRIRKVTTISPLACDIVQRKYTGEPMFPDPREPIEQLRIALAQITVMTDWDYNTLAGGTGECVADAEYRKRRQKLCVFADLGDEVGAGVTNGWSNAKDLFDIVNTSTIDCTTPFEYTENFVVSPACGEETPKSDPACCPCDDCGECPATEVGTSIWFRVDDNGAHYDCIPHGATWYELTYQNQAIPSCENSRPWYGEFDIDGTTLYIAIDCRTTPWTIEFEYGTMNNGCNVTSGPVPECEDGAFSFHQEFTQDAGAACGGTGTTSLSYSIRFNAPP